MSRLNTTSATDVDFGVIRRDCRIWFVYKPSLKSDGIYMVMHAFKFSLLLCALVLMPVLAFASDNCEAEMLGEPLSNQIKSNTERVNALEIAIDDRFLDQAVSYNPSFGGINYCDRLRSYCQNESNDRVYGAIAYEMRYLDQAGRSDFDQRMRFAMHYFSQLSDTMSVNIGISDYVGYLPHMDPFGFQQDNARRQQDLRLDTAYLKISEDHDLSGVNSHLFK